MDGIKLEKQQTDPFFDLEDFMNFSHESRMESQTLEMLTQLWEEWLPELSALRLEKGKNSWVAIWLPEKIEQKVDELWAQSPALGFMANNLAQYLCMSAIQGILPEVAEAGCAPSPEPVPELHMALAQAGLKYGENNTPERRFAIVTHYPFKGGCEICNLRAACPKANGNAEMAQVVLPGYERELLKPVKKF